MRAIAYQTNPPSPILLRLMLGGVCILASSPTYADDAIEQFAASVVKVSTTFPDRKLVTGSGFAWIEPGHVVTAYHLIAGSQRIVVRYDRAGVSRDAKLFKLLRDADLALLQVDDPPAIPPLLSSNKLARPGDRLVVLGYPLGIAKPNTASIALRQLGGRTLTDLAPADVVAAIEKFGFPGVTTPLLNIEGQLVPGHSGAPILNQVGEVVGIANGGLHGGAAGMSWGIPVDQLARLAVSNDKPRPSDTMNGTLKLSDLYTYELRSDYAIQLLEGELSQKTLDLDRAGAAIRSKDDKIDALADMISRRQEPSARARELAMLIGDDDPPYARALRAIAMGDSAAALKLLDEDRAKHLSRLGQNFIATADAHYYAGTYADALVWYEKAGQLNEESIVVAQGIATTLVKLGRARDAIPHFDKILNSIDARKENGWDKSKNQAIMLSNRGGSLVLAGDTELALADFGRSAKILDSIEDSDATGKLGLVRARVYANWAIALATNGDTDTALQRMNSAIQLLDASGQAETDANTDSVRFYRVRALLKSLQGDEPGAKGDLDAAMQRADEAKWSPRNLEMLEEVVQVLHNRGVTNERLAGPRAAIPDLDRAVELVGKAGLVNPLHPFLTTAVRVHLTRAVARKDLDDLVGALRDLEGIAEVCRALGEKHQNFGAQLFGQFLVTRGITLLEAGFPGKALADLNDGIAFYRTAREKGIPIEHPYELFIALNNRGNANAHLQRYQDAIRDFTESINGFHASVKAGALAEARASIEMAFPMLNRGGIYAAVGDNGRARDDLMAAAAAFSRAVEGGRADLTGEFAGALINLSGVELSLGQHDRALQDSRRAVDVLRKAMNGRDAFELERILAIALHTESHCFAQTNQHDAEAAALDESIELFRKVVIRGRTDEAGHLAIALYARGTTYVSAGDKEKAVNHFDDCIRVIREHGIERRPDVVATYASALVERVIASWDNGEQRDRFIADLALVRELPCGLGLKIRAEALRRSLVERPN